MMNKLLLVLLIFIIPIFSFSQNWDDVGSPGFTTGTSNNNQILVDASGEVWVQYTDVANGNAVSVRKFDGTNWNLVGPDGFTPGSWVVQYSNMTFDNSGNPYVVYMEDASLVNKAGVRMFDGTNWVQVGMAGFTTTTAQYLDIAMDNSNVPYVSYKNPITEKIGVMKFDGTNWVQVGLPDLSIGAVYVTSIAIDNAGTPYIAFRDNGASFKARVMKFDGASWVDVGAQGFSNAGSSSVEIVMDNNGVPYVIFVDNSISAKARVMMFDGTAWQNVGSGGVSAGQAWNPSITFDDNNTIYASFRDDGVSSKAVCKFFDGAAWQNVGVNGYSAGLADYVDAAVHPNGTVYSFYRDANVSNKGTAKKLCSSSSTIIASNCSSYTSPSGLYTWTSTGTYMDTIPNSKGCDSVMTINLTITGSDLLLAPYYAYTCAGDTNVLYATMSGAPTFTWNNGLSSASQHTVSPTITTIYQVIGNDGAGCIDTTEYTINVYQKPTISLSVYDSTICQGDSVYVEASSAATYFWYSPLVTTSPGNWLNPTNTTLYFVSAYDASGNCDVLDSVLITVNYNPIVNTYWSSDSICEGDSVQISADGGISYIWDNGLGAGQNQTVYPTVSTNFIVTGTNADGCSSNDSVFIVVNPLPIPTISNTALDLMVNEVFNTYQWYLDASLITGSTTSSFTAAQNGYYYVFVTNLDGCTAFSDSVLISQVGIFDLDMALYKVYPQPFESEFTIESEGYTSLTIFDLTGKLVLTQKLTMNKQKVNTEFLKSGSYLLVLSNGNTSQQQLIIKL